jgi:hypothetical protein
MNVAVAGIPKTIDNDVDYIDRSFGFSTAVEASQAAIRTAKTEVRTSTSNQLAQSDYSNSSFTNVKVLYLNRNRQCATFLTELAL